MIEIGFTDALNSSIERLNAGQSAADCLLVYPQYEGDLAPLLETVDLVKRAQFDADEAVRARERQRLRFENALNAPLPARPSITRHSFAGLAASVVLILALFVGGAVVAAERSIPGDALYRFKLWTESVHLTLANNDANLQAVFAARRIEEARQLVRLRRIAELTFTGTVTATYRGGILIDGLPVHTEDTPIAPGSRVEVNVFTTSQGTLIARSLRVLAELPAAPSIPATPAPRQTQPATSTVASSATRVRPTENPLRAINETPVESRSVQSAACQEPPEGWIRYIVRSGDTLSALARASEIPADEIIAANCLQDRSHILAGQVIYLPPARSRIETSRPIPSEPPNQTGDATPNLREGESGSQNRSG